MREHDCSQECPCGHWKPGISSKYRAVKPVRGKITLDVYDGLPDADANAYRDYEPEDDDR